MLDAARAATRDVLADLTASDATAKRIHDSYETARQRAIRWAGVAGKAFLDAREG